jgi:hypothetical protein
LSHSINLSYRCAASILSVSQKSLGSAFMVAMNDTPLIDLILRPHDIQLVLSDRWGHRSALTVSVPDLRDAPRTAWGDWGPKYTVSVPSDRLLRLTLVAGEPPVGTRHLLDLNRLELESPMLGAVRSLTPLYLDLPLALLGLRLHVFYDLRGRPDRAEVAPLHVPSVELSPYVVELRDEREAKREPATLRAVPARRPQRESAHERR